MSLGAVTGLLRKGQVAIPEERLKELEAKERAHDAYLRATQRMRAILLDMQHKVHTTGYEVQWTFAYGAAIKQFSELVVEESRNGD